MKESIVVNRWKAEARAEAKAEAKAEAQMEERIECVLAILGARGTVPDDLANAIRSCTDVPKLRQWLSAAIHTESFDAFRAAAGM